MTTWNEPCIKDELCEARPGHFGACDSNERAKAALANSRRVSGDNADIAVKAMSQLTEAQEMLEVLLEAMVNGTDAIIANAVIKAEGLIETQKAVKLYE